MLLAGMVKALSRGRIELLSVKKKTGKKVTCFQLDDFTRGQIIGMYKAGVKPSRISANVYKTDGSSPQPDAVRKTIRKFKEDKSWRGSRQPGSGRPVHSCPLLVTFLVAFLL